MVLNNYIPPFKPVANITPFTYRDGVTYLEILENLRTYVNDVVVDFVNTQITGLGDQFEIEVNKLIAEVNTALDAQTAANQDAIDALTASVNDIVTTLNDNITAQNASVDEKLEAVDTAIADLTIYVNNQVASIIGAEATINDAVVDAIVDNASSATRASLDALYSGATVSDSAVNALIGNPSSDTRTTLDTLYADNGVDDVVLASIVNDTGSNTRAALNSNFASQDTEDIVSSGRLSTGSLAGTISDAITAETDDVVATEIANLSSATRAVLNNLYRPKLREVACVLRRASSTSWEILNDAGHESIGVASVTIVGANRLVLTYDFTASKVHSFIVTIDDAFASSTTELRVGASVGLSSSSIYFYTTAGGATPVNPGDLSTPGANLFVYGLFKD